MKEKKARVSRVEESREVEQRKHEKRPKFNMFYTGPMDIDPAEIPEGMEYRYIRTDTLDRPDNGRLPEMSQKGWTVVPASRHPQKAFSDPLGRLTSVRDYIYYKGAVLCERPIELGEQEYEILRRKNESDLLSMPALHNTLGDPAVVRSDTYTSKNITFGH